jgi:hypothetical protein
MQHGIYLITEDAVESFEREWLDGEQLDFITTTHTIGMDSANGITWNGSRESLRRVFGETDRRLIVAYEIGDSNDNQHNYAPLADGNKDADFREFARDLVDAGLGDTILAPNAEMNQSWSGRYPNDPATYADAFARLVREMQSVEGADFEFCFAPAPNSLGVAPACWPVQSTHWPSDEPPPYVTPSFYEDAPQFPDDISGLSDSELAHLREQAWTEHHKPNLDAWVDFADARDAPLALREWGAAYEWVHPTSNDNPSFITDVLNYARDNEFAFQAYWNAYASGGGTHEIYPDPDGRLTEAGNAWREFVRSDMAGGDVGDGPDSPDDSRDNDNDNDRDSESDSDNDSDGRVEHPLANRVDAIETTVAGLQKRLATLEQRLPRLPARCQGATADGDRCLRTVRDAETCWQHDETDIREW